MTESIKNSAIARMIKNIVERDKGVFGLCFLYTIFATGIPFFAVLLPKFLIEKLIVPNPKVAGVLTIVIIFFVVGAIIYFLKTFIGEIADPRITVLRIDYVRDLGVKLLKMDFKYTEDSSFSDKYERAFNSISTNNNGIEGIYHKLFEVPASLVIVLILSIFVAIKSPWIILAILVNIAATTLVAIKVQKINYSYKEKLSKHKRRVGYYSDTTQDFAYGKDVRIYDLKDRIIDNFNFEIKGYLDVFKLIKNKEYYLSFITLLTLLISDGVTYGMLIYLAVQGMSIADFSMYLVATARLSLELNTLSGYVTFILEEYMYVKDFYMFMDKDFGEKGGEAPAVPKGETLEIEFKDISFKYPNTDKNVYTNFSLKIPKGQKLALVGINGAGKTTLVKLLTGLYKVDSGEIIINGINVNDYKKSELFSMFSVVFQDVNILAYTIAENIAGASKDIDYEKVDKVLKKVGLYEKVQSLPKGTENLMLKVIEEDGAIFSGGESQKLSIARALYKGGNMVIMDEPTSALDALAEAEIYSEFNDLTEGKTSIYISHRLASTKFCDVIALIDGDGLREYGTHEELMEKGGVYYDMFMTQGKYYRESQEECSA